jgi:hypothetical protein
VFVHAAGDVVLGLGEVGIDLGLPVAGQVDQSDVEFEVSALFADDVGGECFCSFAQDGDGFVVFVREAVDEGGFACTAFAQQEDVES